MSIDWSVAAHTEKLIFFIMPLCRSFCFLIRLINQTYWIIDLFTFYWLIYLMSHCLVYLDDDCRPCLFYCGTLPFLFVFLFIHTLMLLVQLKQSLYCHAQLVRATLYITFPINQPTLAFINSFRFVPVCHVLLGSGIILSSSS